MSTDVDKFFWVGSIETTSGIAANVLDMQPDMISLDDIATSLSNICRYNGHVPSFFSVAEHSYNVALWLIGNGHSKQVALTGLLHDAAEAYVGDMVRPLKRHPDFGAVHQQVEAQVSAVVHQVLGGVYPHPEIVHEADRIAYDWEVAHIRSGRRTGWNPPFAKAKFLEAYRMLTNG